MSNQCFFSQTYKTYLYDDRPKNKSESQGESIQDSCKTSNDVRCRDVGSEESTREEVGCGGNEDVKMDEWSHQDGQN